MEEFGGALPVAAEAGGDPFEVVHAPATAGRAAFAPGTLIRTSEIDVDVATLAAGDALLTSAGNATVARLKRHVVECRRAETPPRVWPIRIAANAFGRGRPTCDLVVSPATMLCLDLLGELLVPVAGLVNGATITQSDCDRADFFEVELERPGVILANGLRVLAGIVPEADGPRRVVTEGPILETIRMRLADRFAALGWTRDTDPFAGLRLEADGTSQAPTSSGLGACFVMSVTARNVWLVSAAATPRQLFGSLDDRLLGICVGAISIDDGLTPKRSLVLDDPRLCVGFHEPESAVRRWTTGRARLPASLWDGCVGHVMLRIDLDGYALPRWVAPEPAAEAAA